MNGSRTAYDWGLPAVAALGTILAVTAGLAFGVVLAWATLTDDLVLAWRVIGWSAWVVVFAAASIVVVRSAVGLYRLRRTR